MIGAAMADKRDAVDGLLALLAEDSPQSPTAIYLDTLMISIADDPALARKLMTAVAAGPAGRNSSELADTVRDLLGRLAIRIDRAADQGEATVDSIDKYSVPLAAIVVTAGFGGVLLGTFVAAPIVLAAGLVGFASGAAGRYWVKQAAIRDRSNAKLLKHLQGMLK